MTPPSSMSPSQKMSGGGAGTSPPPRRHGIATALHRKLLSTRPEPRATLLVEPDNHPARNAYLHWGWQHIGTLKPFPDSPTYDSMIISLPLPLP